MTDDEVQKLLCDINTRLDQYELKIRDLESDLEIAFKEIVILTSHVKWD